MISYDGMDEFDAADLIDWSQTRAVVGYYLPGHARGHARAPLGRDFFSTKPQLRGNVFAGLYEIGLPVPIRPGLGDARCPAHKESKIGDDEVG